MCEKAIIIFCAKPKKIAHTAKFSDLCLTAALGMSPKRDFETKKPAS